MLEPAYDNKFIQLERRIASMQQQLNQVQNLIPKRRGIPAGGAVTGEIPPAGIPTCRFVLYTEQGPT